MVIDKQRGITEHFEFRIISKDDYDLYYELMLDEPVIQWIFQDEMSEKLRKDTLDAMMIFYWKPLIEEVNRNTFTIFFKESRTFLGEICLYYNKYSRPEVGISILDKYRGKGIGKSILKEWGQWLVSISDIRQLDVHIEEGNVASRRCFEELGAKYIGNNGDRYYCLEIPVSS